MALTEACGDEKGRTNMQNESGHRLESYFILLNVKEQTFDDKFLLSIQFLTTQGQYLGLILSKGKGFGADKKQ